eukprot:g3345.t1
MNETIRNLKAEKDKLTQSLRKQTEVLTNQSNIIDVLKKRNEELSAQVKAQTEEIENSRDEINSHEQNHEKNKLLLRRTKLIGLWRIITNYHFKHKVLCFQLWKSENSAAIRSALIEKYDEESQHMFKQRANDIRALRLLSILKCCAVKCKAEGFSRLKDHTRVTRVEHATFRKQMACLALWRTTSKLYHKKTTNAFHSWKSKSTLFAHKEELSKRLNMYDQQQEQASAAYTKNCKLLRLFSIWENVLHQKKLSAIKTWLLFAQQQLKDEMSKTNQHKLGVLSEKLQANKDKLSALAEKLRANKNKLSIASEALLTTETKLSQNETYHERKIILIGLWKALSQFCVKKKAIAFGRWKLHKAGYETQNQLRQITINFSRREEENLSTFNREKKLIRLVCIWDAQLSQTKLKSFRQWLLRVNMSHHEFIHRAMTRKVAMLGLWKVLSEFYQKHRRAAFHRWKATSNHMSILKIEKRDAEKAMETEVRNRKLLRLVYLWDNHVSLRMMKYFEKWTHRNDVLRRSQSRRNLKRKKALLGLWRILTSSYRKVQRNRFTRWNTATRLLGIQQANARILKKSSEKYKNDMADISHAHTKEVKLLRLVSIWNLRIRSLKTNTFHNWLQRIQIRERDKKYEDLRNDFERISGKLNKKDEENRDLRNDFNLVSGKLNKRHQENKELEMKMTLLGSENEKKYENLENDFKSMRGKLTKKNEENKNLQNSFDSISGKLNKKIQENERLAMKVKLLGLWNALRRANRRVSTSAFRKWKVYSALVDSNKRHKKILHDTVHRYKKSAKDIKHRHHRDKKLLRLVSIWDSHLEKRKARVVQLWASKVKFATHAENFSTLKRKMTLLGLWKVVANFYGTYKRNALNRWKANLEIEKAYNRYETKTSLARQMHEKKVKLLRLISIWDAIICRRKTSVLKRLNFEVQMHKKQRLVDSAFETLQKLRKGEKVLTQKIALLGLWKTVSTLFHKYRGLAFNRWRAETTIERNRERDRATQLSMVKKYNQDQSQALESYNRHVKIVRLISTWDAQLRARKMRMFSAWHKVTHHQAYQAQFKSTITDEKNKKKILKRKMVLIGLWKVLTSLHYKLRANAFHRWRNSTILVMSKIGDDDGANVTIQKIREEYNNGRKKELEHYIRNIKVLRLVSIWDEHLEKRKLNALYTWSSFITQKRSKRIEKALFRKMALIGLWRVLSSLCLKHKSATFRRWERTSVLIDKHRKMKAALAQAAEKFHRDQQSSLQQYSREKKVLRLVSLWDDHLNTTKMATIKTWMMRVNLIRHDEEANKKAVSIGRKVTLLGLWRVMSSLFHKYRGVYFRRWKTTTVLLGDHQTLNNELKKVQEEHSHTLTKAQKKYYKERCLVRLLSVWDSHLSCTKARVFKNWQMSVFQQLKNDLEDETSSYNDTVKRCKILQNLLDTVRKQLVAAQRKQTEASTQAEDLKNELQELYRKLTHYSGRHVRVRHLYLAKVDIIMRTQKSNQLSRMFYAWRQLNLREQNENLREEKISLEKEKDEMKHEIETLSSNKGTNIANDLILKEKEQYSINLLKLQADYNILEVKNTERIAILNERIRKLTDLCDSLTSECAKERKLVMDLRRRLTMFQSRASFVSNLTPLSKKKRLPLPSPPMSSKSKKRTRNTQQRSWTMAEEIILYRIATKIAYFTEYIEQRKRSAFAKLKFVSVRKNVEENQLAMQSEEGIFFSEVETIISDLDGEEENTTVESKEQITVDFKVKEQRRKFVEPPVISRMVSGPRLPRPSPCRNCRTLDRRLQASQEEFETRMKKLEENSDRLFFEAVVSALDSQADFSSEDEDNNKIKNKGQSSLSARLLLKSPSRGGARNRCKDCVVKRKELQKLRRKLQDLDPGL